MIFAFTFMTLDTKYDSSHCISEIQKISHVKEVHELYGIYDVLAIVEVESTSQLKELTFKTVRRLEFVKSTITLIAFESYKNDLLSKNRSPYVVSS